MRRSRNIKIIKLFIMAFLGVICLAGTAGAQGQGAGSMPPVPMVFGGLTFTLPEGWVSQNPPFPHITAYYTLRYDEYSFADLFIIVEERFDSLTLEDVLVINQRDLETMLGGYTPQATTEIILNGLDALRFDFLFQAEGVPVQLKGVGCFIIVRETIFTLIFFFRAGDTEIMEPHIQEVFAGVSGSEETAPLPEFPGTLPALEDHRPEPQKTVFRDPLGRFTIDLPAQSTLMQSFAEGAQYSTPMEGEVTILVFPNEEAAGNVAAQIAHGKNFHGENPVSAAGLSGSVALYSSVNPENAQKLASLLATYPGLPLVLIVVLPADNYQEAQEWLIELFESVQLSR